MKIAFCLYGQPRCYKKGYEVFKEWLEFNNINIEKEVDFFFHTWTLEPGETYNASPYRNIPVEELKYTDTVEGDLIDLYNPVNFIFQKQKPPTFFPVDYIKSSISYQNIRSEKTKDSVPNVLSQLYSLSQVHKLCKNHVENTGTEYNFIIVSRFDFQNSLKRIKLCDWDYKKDIMLVDSHYPRKLISASFIIMPPSIFFVWMNMYNDLDKFIHNLEIVEIMKSINEEWIFNTEEIYTASYLYHFSNYNNIAFVNPPIKFTNNI
jgi:hypothetical protein